MMTKFHKFMSLSTSFAVAAITLSACGSQNGEVTFKSGGMTHTFAEGKAAVPKDFPLPVYPGATTTGSVSAEGGATDENSKYLMLASNDTVDQVSKYYLDELKADGWKIDNQQASGNLINLSASRDDIEGSVMVSGEGGKTTISLQACKAGGDVKAPEEEKGSYEPNKVTPPTD